MVIVNNTEMQAKKHAYVFCAPFLPSSNGRWADCPMRTLPNVAWWSRRREICRLLVDFHFEDKTENPVVKLCPPHVELIPEWKILFTPKEYCVSCHFTQAAFRRSQAGKIVSNLWLQVKDIWGTSASTMVPSLLSHHC